MQTRKLNQNISRRLCKFLDFQEENNSSRFPGVLDTMYYKSHLTCYSTTSEHSGITKQHLNWKGRCICLYLPGTYVVAMILMSKSNKYS